MHFLRWVKRWKAAVRVEEGAKREAPLAGRGVKPLPLTRTRKGFLVTGLN